MRIFLVIVALSLVFSSHLAADESCMDKARTQFDMNQCAGSEFEKADKELNRLYQSILTEYADNKLFIEKLKAAQLAWIKFRDAEMEALFPIKHKDEIYIYGSAYPMCYSIWMKKITEERTAQLKKWSDKIQEGDVCAGSIKYK
jgi:uncharacterized protein YecT (DUF1311 family)